MSSFIITSFYTLNTPYQRVMHDYLMPSLLNLPIERDIRGVPNLGSWQKNTSYKARFLWEMLNKHPDKNIVFLDGDAELLKYPKIFEEIPEEYIIASHILDRNLWYGKEYGLNRYELLSGTLWLRNCSETKNLLIDWVDRVEKSKNWEQRVLHQLVKEKNIPVYHLPLEYCYIISLPDGRDPIINLVEGEVVVRH